MRNYQDKISDNQLVPLVAIGIMGVALILPLFGLKPVIWMAGMFLTVFVAVSGAASDFTEKAPLVILFFITFLCLLATAIVTVTEEAEGLEAFQWSAAGQGLAIIPLIAAIVVYARAKKRRI